MSQRDSVDQEMNFDADLEILQVDNQIPSQNQNQMQNSLEYSKQNDNQSDIQSQFQDVTNNDQAPFGNIQQNQIQVQNQNQQLPQDQPAYTHEQPPLPPEQLTNEATSHQKIDSCVVGGYQQVGVYENQMKLQPISCQQDIPTQITQQNQQQLQYNYPVPNQQYYNQVAQIDNDKLPKKNRFKEQELENKKRKESSDWEDQENQKNKKIQKQKQKLKPLNNSTAVVVVYSDANPAVNLGANLTTFCCLGLYSRNDTCCHWCCDSLIYLLTFPMRLIAYLVQKIWGCCLRDCTKITCPSISQNCSISCTLISSNCDRCWNGMRNSITTSCLSVCTCCSGCTGIAMMDDCQNCYKTYFKGCCATLTGCFSAIYIVFSGILSSVFSCFGSCCKFMGDFCSKFCEMLVQFCQIIADCLNQCCELFGDCSCDCNDCL